MTVTFDDIVTRDLTDDRNRRDARTVPDLVTVTASDRNKPVVEQTTTIDNNDTIPIITIISHLGPRHTIPIINLIHHHTYISSSYHRIVDKSTWTVQVTIITIITIPTRQVNKFKSLPLSSRRTIPLIIAQSRTRTHSIAHRRTHKSLQSRHARAAHCTGSRQAHTAPTSATSQINQSSLSSSSSSSSPISLQQTSQQQVNWS